jgi:exopolyphosphatase/guanosine-5'-triphosphate,3'-diphosphate pyrophosphatase
LWQQLAAPLNLRPSDQELIESAALLANVGYLINFEGHHKHSYHLILNSELSGFEREQLRLLALVARYHRGSRPKKKHDDYRALGDDDRRRVAAAAAILRLALALDRTHQQRIQDVRAQIAGGHVEITVDAQGDADVDLWAARSKVELFEKVFDRKVVISAVDPAARRQTKSRERNAASLDSSKAAASDDPVDAGSRGARPR